MLPSSFFTSILIHSRRPIRIGRAVSTLQNVISIEPQRRPDQIPHQQRRGDHQRTHHQPQTALHDRNLHNTQSRWNIACLLHKIFRRPQILKRPSEKSNQSITKIVGVTGTA